MSEYVSIENLKAQAEGYSARGQWHQAERAYRTLLTQSHVTDYEYDDWARRLARTYQHIQGTTQIAYIYTYLHQFDRARGLVENDPAFMAQLAVLQGRPQEAAEFYLKAKRPAHAAVTLQKAGMQQQALPCLRDLIAAPALRGQDYEMALIRFNYGIALAESESKTEAANDALVESQQILETVAAKFESKGQRDRAFDCYQVLIELGRRISQFENLSEGYLGCIRVLEDDNLKFYALQYYEDFIAQALEKREFHAAASLLTDASKFCTRTGLPYSSHYLSQAGDAWTKCAQRHVEDGVSMSLVENALLAAVGCYSNIGDFMSVRSIFQSLAALDLPQKEKNRYAQVAARYKSVGAPPTYPRFPEYLRKQNAYADIWYVDLLSWEIGSDVHALALSIVGDLRFHNSVRRRALSILLTVAASHRDNTLETLEVQERVIRLVGELQSYGALLPLEKMYESDDKIVRRACVQALRFLYFKRSFVILRQALDDVEEVREVAIEVLRGRVFPHALNPLRQIFEDSDDGAIRGAAMEAVGKIQSIEAGEYLIEVVRRERGEAQEMALRALRYLENPDIAPILKQHVEVEQDQETRNALLNILKGYR